MLTIKELWRYPVKSMLGEQLEASEVTPIGLPGDRAFGIRDLETGNVLTARREPRLLFATARWHDGEVEIHGPGGDLLDSDESLSKWLGRPVELALAGDEGGVYENVTDTENETDWISWQGPAHAWHDSSRSRLSLVSTATLGDWAPARFRANILLDGAGEDGLVGQQVGLGTAMLDVMKQIDRCIMVTRAQPGVDIDRDVLRAIHRTRGGNLAIGALVIESGRMRVGDRLSERR